MRPAQPRTIQIFLPDGNPRGIKIAEFTNGTLQLVLIPRAHLSLACSRPELSRVGLYFLVGETEIGDLPRLYIGEAEDCSARLKEQNKAKDWWGAAIVCSSKVGGLTKAHVKYLEWQCHREASEAKRFQVDNATVPTRSHVPEPVEADLQDHFATIQVLAGTLGFPVFDKIHRPPARDLLICKGKYALAQGEYSEDGFIVFAGSLANLGETNSIHSYLTTIRQRLLDSGALEVVDDRVLRFTRDHIFPSPSQAAAVVLGRSANGWVQWKYPDGRTLDEVKRAGVSSDESKT